MDRWRLLRSWPLQTQLGAISVGIVDGRALCDLCYEEDSKAEVDLNLVMNGDGEFVEVQGAAEGAPFRRTGLQDMLETGEAALGQVFEAQRAALELA